jgi:nucleoside-diphosphate-sugar epimerase
MKKRFSGTSCIVTGGSSLIGQHLVKQLLDEGADVYVIDNFLFGAKRKTIDKRATLFKGDVREKKSFDKLPKITYDYFFHFAAPSSTELFKKNNVECVNITTLGFLHAVNFCIQNKTRLIYPSSGSLYSGIEPPHHEQASLNESAMNKYAKNKYLLEKIADLYRPDCDSLGLRILAGYGPGEDHKYAHGYSSIVYTFCRDMYEGTAPEIWGDGEQRRDCVYIKDIADIILSLAQNCPEPIINIGSGTDISFNEVIAIINKKLGTNIQAKYIPRPKLYLEKTLADTTLLRKYYKKPFTSIEAGIKKTLASFSPRKKK